MYFAHVSSLEWGGERISHKELTNLFCESQSPHKLVNLFFILVKVKDKLTDLWVRCILENNIIKTLCETRAYPLRVLGPMRARPGTDRSPWLSVWG